MPIKEVIWKLQKPLSTNINPPQVLAYTEGRENYNTFPMKQRKINKLFGEKLKLYVYGYVENKQLVVTGLAPEQDW